MVRCRAAPSQRIHTDHIPRARSFQLRDALRVGCITLHEDFFSVSMEPRAVLKILEDELRAFAIGVF